MSDRIFNFSPSTSKTVVSQVIFPSSTNVAAKVAVIDFVHDPKCHLSSLSTF